MKSKTKSITFILLTILIVVTLVGCGSKKESRSVEETKEVIKKGMGEGEEIINIEINDKDITIEIDLKEDEAKDALENLAVTRYQSITEQLLEDDFWESIRIEFKNIGSITMNSKEAVTNEHGIFFETLDIMENFKSK